MYRHARSKPALIPSPVSLCSWLRMMFCQPQTFLSSGKCQLELHLPLVQDITNGKGTFIIFSLLPRLIPEDESESHYSMTSTTCSGLRLMSSPSTAFSRLWGRLRVFFRKFCIHDVLGAQTNRNVPSLWYICLQLCTFSCPAPPN